MKTNYSPYNRTYKYICLQNQLAHLKNKASAKSLGISNISISSSPHKKNSINLLKNSSYCSTKPNFDSSNNESQYLGIKSKEISFSFVSPYRVIHMNQSFEKKKKRDYYLENERLAKRLCNITCNITTKEQSLKNFQDHLHYKEIAQRYDRRGELKELIRFNSSNSLTASRTQQIRHSGIDLCNVALSTKRKSEKKLISSEKHLVKKPKSNIIKLY